MSGSHPGFIRDYVWHRPLNPLSIKLCVWPLYTVTGYWLLINLLIDQFTTISNITTGNKCIIFGLPDLVWLVMWIIERQFCGSWWKMKEVSGMQHGSHHNYVIIQLFIKCDRQCRNTAQYMVLAIWLSLFWNQKCVVWWMSQSIHLNKSEYEMHRDSEGHEKILPTASNISCDKTRRHYYPENLTLE